MNCTDLIQVCLGLLLANAGDLYDSAEYQSALKKLLEQCPQDAIQSVKPSTWRKEASSPKVKFKRGLSTLNLKDGPTIQAGAEIWESITLPRAVDTTSRPLIAAVHDLQNARAVDSKLKARHSILCLLVYYEVRQRHGSAHWKLDEGARTAIKKLANELNVDYDTLIAAYTTGRALVKLLDWFPIGVLLLVSNLDPWRQDRISRQAAKELRDHCERHEHQFMQRARELSSVVENLIILGLRAFGWVLIDSAENCSTLSKLYDISTRTAVPFVLDSTMHAFWLDELLMDGTRR